ncbi:uncharacterized protein LOC122398923 [Colletes gigas]|uniref:uncharacterized protein LOC122398923 n=1 Tax=Colletes gigas TaxID=935657 RepID=UPI001C9B57D6|nr:uncharacterized protein LOC122398923 [Colletes gigas]
MACFRPTFQIPGLITSKASFPLINRKENGTNTLCVRTFWFFKSKQKSIENVSGSSKCPRKKSKNKVQGSTESKGKVCNCVEEKPAEIKLTWWEEIFGPDPKRFWPDPCICRLAVRQRRKIRKQDSRLLDPRYQETAGDVFLYTEQLKRHSRPCLEPQPKPPPAFKVPKAVLYRMMNDSDERKSFSDIVKIHQSDTNLKNSFDTERYRIPYEEMRPSTTRKRRMFNCREGIRSEDIVKPISAELNSFGVPLIVQQSNIQQRIESSNDKCSKKIEKAPVTKNNILKEISQKRSRIEQLKIEIQQKDTSRCIALTDFEGTKMIRS